MNVRTEEHAVEEYTVERYTPSVPDVTVKNPVDVWALVPRLQARFRRRAPRGYQRGKREIRDALRRTMRIGPFRAAYLVDRMEAEGAIVYRESEPSVRESWGFCARSEGSEGDAASSRGDQTEA